MFLTNAATGELQTIVARDARKSTLRPDQMQVSHKRGEASGEVPAGTDRERHGRRARSGSGAGGMAHQGQHGEAGTTRCGGGYPIDKLPTIDSFDATITSRQGDLLGVLYMDSRSPSSAFSDLDRQVLRTLAHEAATVVENARLFAASRDKARLDHEIEIASQIQRRLLPKTMPDQADLAVAGSTLACYSVGGDCFDVIKLENGRHGFFVGDVAGKGVSAALLATLLQGVFFTTAAMDIALPSVFSRVNQYLCERSGDERYATAFYGVLDKTGRFEYVNAGHVRLRRSCAENRERWMRWPPRISLWECSTKRNTKAGTFSWSRATIW